MSIRGGRLPSIRSEFQTFLNLVRGGGGRNFSIISEIQNILNYPRGGGGASLIGNFSQIFPFFFSDGSPKKRTSGSKRCARSPIQSVRDEPNQFNMQSTTQSMIRGLFEFQDCPVSTVHSNSRMVGGLRNRGQGSELLSKPQHQLSTTPRQPQLIFGLIWIWLYNHHHHHHRNSTLAIERSQCSVN